MTVCVICHEEATGFLATCHSCHTTAHLSCLAQWERHDRRAMSGSCPVCEQLAPAPRRREVEAQEGDRFCPGCGIQVDRISGCDSVRCLICETSFKFDEAPQIQPQDPPQLGRCRLLRFHQVLTDANNPENVRRRAMGFSLFFLIIILLTWFGSGALQRAHNNQIWESYSQGLSHRSQLEPEIQLQEALLMKLQHNASQLSKETQDLKTTIDVIQTWSTAMSLLKIEGPVVLPLQRQAELASKYWLLQHDLEETQIQVQDIEECLRNWQRLQNLYVGVKDVEEMSLLQPNVPFSHICVLCMSMFCCAVLEELDKIVWRVYKTYYLVAFMAVNVISVSVGFLQIMSSK